MRYNLPTIENQPRASFRLAFEETVTQCALTLKFADSLSTLDIAQTLQSLALTSPKHHCVRIQVIVENQNGRLDQEFIGLSDGVGVLLYNSREACVLGAGSFVPQGDPLDGVDNRAHRSFISRLLLSPIDMSEWARLMTDLGKAWVQGNPAVIRDTQARYQQFYHRARTILDHFHP